MARGLVRSKGGRTWDVIEKDEFLASGQDRAKEAKGDERKRSERGKRRPGA